MFWLIVLAVAGLLFGCMLAWWFRRELIPLLVLFALALSAFGVYRLYQTRFDLRLKEAGVVAIVLVAIAIPLLSVAPYLLGKLEEVRIYLRAALRNIHGAQDASYASLWDVVVPIAFLVAFAILGYADYTLFAARIAGLLNIQGALPVNTTLLNLTLGALYVVSLVTVGFVLSDAFGHSPAGQSLTTGRLKEEKLKGLRVALLVVLALVAVATLFLAIWTVEITILNTDGHVSATIFLISFSLVAFAALLLAFLPALMGVIALGVPVSYLASGAIWVASAACWLALWLFDKVVAAFHFALNLLARAGAYLTGRGKKAPEEWEPRTVVHAFASEFPLLYVTSPVQETVVLTRPSGSELPASVKIPGEPVPVVAGSNGASTHRRARLPFMNNTQKPGQ